MLFDVFHPNKIPGPIHSSIKKKKSFGKVSCCSVGECWSLNYPPRYKCLRCTYPTKITARTKTLVLLCLQPDHIRHVGRICGPPTDRSLFIMTPWRQNVRVRNYYQKRRRKKYIYRKLFRVSKFSKAYKTKFLIRKKKKKKKYRKNYLLSSSHFKNR